MAKRINRSIADAFSAALDETEEWKVDFNLRELVEDSFFSIEKARERKATWEQIAEILQNAVGDNVEIKADTLRQYYFEALKNKEELTKRKRKKSGKRKNSSVKTSESANKSDRRNLTKDEKSLDTPEIKADTNVSHTRESGDTPSSFNLRSS